MLEVIENTLPPIITSLLENDMYKFSMGQAIFHQFPSYMTTWTFKCRNRDVYFTGAMFVFWTLNCIYGWYKWTKSAKYDDWIQKEVIK